jgi:hypothetical protein
MCSFICARTFVVMRIGVLPLLGQEGSDSARSHGGDHSWAADVVESKMRAVCGLKEISPWELSHNMRPLKKAMLVALFDVIAIDHRKICPARLRRRRFCAQPWAILSAERTFWLLRFMPRSNSPAV